MKTSDCKIDLCNHDCPYCGRPVTEEHRACGYCAIAEQVPAAALRLILKAKELLERARKNTG